MIILTQDHPRYPVLLKEISDPPLQLYAEGNLDCLDMPCIGIVGTRRASSYGEQQAVHFAKILATHGICIVSGLAYGIDAAAHKGALLAQGKTIAVIAQPLDELQPTRHRALARSIVKQGGLVLSEKASGAPMYKSDYLVRNRLISGLSKGVIVVEAAHRSGALNTARQALDQNREVMAIPGRTNDPQSAGTNRLIANAGARLVSSPKDVIEFVGLKAVAAPLPQLPAMHLKVLKALYEKSRRPSELGEHFKKDLGTLYSVLTELEMQGLIRRDAQQRYSVVPP